MPKIPALPPMTSVDTADELAIEDVSVTTTKRMTLTKLKEWFQTLAGWVTTAALGDATVTPDKLATGAARAVVTTNESTSSSSFTNLSTVGPEVTVTIGANGLALVSIYARLSSATVSNVPAMGFALSGANTVAASFDYSISHAAASGAAEARAGATFLLTGLTPGSTTFTAKYARESGTVSSVFNDRRLSVVPL